MKYWLAVVLLLYVTPSKGEERVLQAPNYSGSGSYNHDEIATRKIRCRSGLESLKKLEIGATGDDNDYLVYARVIIPIGRVPVRLDCNKLFQLQLEEMEIELQKLRAMQEQGNVLKDKSKDR